MKCIKKTEGCYNESQLVEMLACDNAYAFQLFYDRHQVRIYNLAVRYLKCSEIARDVVQEVFMKLWTQRKTVQFIGPVEGWLFSVGKNNILNRYKRMTIEYKALDQMKLIHENVDNSLQKNIDSEQYKFLFNKAMRSLSEKQLEVYLLAKKENLSYLQIAAHLNISPLTVKTHMSRALNNIRYSLCSEDIF